MSEKTTHALTELAKEVGMNPSALARIAIERYVVETRIKGSLSIPVANLAGLSEFVISQMYSQESVNPNEKLCHKT